MSMLFLTKGEKGYSLAEIMVASAVMFTMTLVGLSAYNYFNKETKDQLSNLNDIQHFNLLTKDMLSFTEAAGLSTLYLNVPVRIKNCEEGRPCLRQLKTQAPTNCKENGGDCRQVDTWVPAETIPDIVKNEQCLQFFRDAHGRPDTKQAFPERPESTEQQAFFRDYNFPPGQGEYFFNWPLVDEKSTPFLLLKVRDVGAYFTLNKGMSFSADSLRSSTSTASGLRKSLVDSNLPPEQAKLFVGYPMMFYGAQFQGHFGFYYADSILPCKDNIAACIQVVKNDIYKSSDGELPFSIANSITDKSFVIGLLPIDTSSDFFSRIYEGLNPPAGDEPRGCKFTWGARQDSEDYLFPNGLLSIFDGPKPASDVNPDSNEYYNPNLYHKYAAYQMPNSAGVTPYGFIIPIDLVRYSVEKVGPKPQDPRYQMVSELWHATKIKKLTKISNMRGPFYFNRKMGSSEFSMMYAPVERPESPALSEENRK